MFVIIAAIGKNNELGKENKLIWKLSEDLKFFKQQTLNKTIIMGRKTFESLPKVLPNRKHIVLTNDKTYKIEDENVLIENNIKEVIEKYQDSQEEIYIIGGAKLYEQFLPYAKVMYITEVNKSEENAEVYFPRFNKEKYKKEIIKECKEELIKYNIVKYSK